MVVVGTTSAVLASEKKWVQSPEQQYRVADAKTRISSGKHMTDQSTTVPCVPTRIIVIPRNPWTWMRVKLRRKLRPEFREWLKLSEYNGFIPIHIDSGYCIDRPDFDDQPPYLIAEIEAV